MGSRSGHFTCLGAWTAERDSTIIPDRALLGPRPRVRHRPERALGQRLGAVDRFELEDGHLEVRREEEQVEELRDPKPA